MFFNASHMAAAAAFLGMDPSGSWWMVLISIVAAVGLVLTCVAAWGLNLIGMPGNWIGVAVIALYAWLGPESGRLAMGFWSAVIAFLIAALGEVVEFLAGAAGASRAGASRRATVFSIVGSMMGAIIGAFVGLPIPVAGPILAAVLFGGVGATAGAVYAEWTNGKPWRESWTIGQAAFVGRTFGTLGKAAIGLLIVLISLLGVCV